MYIQDVSVLRRLIFAATFLPTEYPMYYEAISKFAVPDDSKHPPLSLQNTRVLVENLMALNAAAFTQDFELTKELTSMSSSTGKPTGLILMPEPSTCKECGSPLLLRSDRPSHLVLYTESLGTVPALHYHKFCQKWRHGCKLVQYYGYTTNGENSGLNYDENWNTLPYFVSSRETAFETKLLKHFDAELLLGQISYKQKADIYNYQHDYHDVKKQCSVFDSDSSNTTRFVCFSIHA